MHAVLLTLIALGGGADLASGRITQSNADIYSASALGGGGYDGGGCSTCGGAGGGGHFANKGGHMGGWFGHMPQTCYSPRYGCYYGSNRHMNRYPAFHGTFYRRPYNYRNLFDYPWHAEMHEPTSMFSYNVIGEGGAGGAGGSVSDIPQPPPVVPSPAFESAQRMQKAANGVATPGDAAATSAMRRAVPAGSYRRDITDPSVVPAATLRR
jgi:hypothetical protein